MRILASSILTTFAIVLIASAVQSQTAPPLDRTMVYIPAAQTELESDDWPDGDVVVRAVDESLAVPFTACLPSATGSGREIRLYHGAGMGEFKIDAMGAMIAFNGGGGSVYTLAIQYGTVYLIDIGVDEWTVYGTTPPEQVLTGF